MCKDSEVVILIMCIISVGFIGRFSKSEILRSRFFYWGLLSMCLSVLASVAEGFLWKGLFHAIEHLCFAVSGLLFARACLDLYRSGEASAATAADIASTETEAAMDVVWVRAR